MKRTFHGRICIGGGVGNHPTDRNWAVLNFSTSNFYLLNSALLGNPKEPSIHKCFPAFLGCKEAFSMVDSILLHTFHQFVKVFHRYCWCGGE